MSGEAAALLVGIVVMVALVFNRIEVAALRRRIAALERVERIILYKR